MEKITITIETISSAFEEEEELPRILTKLARQLLERKEPTKLLDYNGNTVGTVEYE